MSEGFHGAWVHKVDGKGRVSVPADFRRALKDDGGEPILRLAPNLDGDPCIDGYAAAYLEQIKRKIRKMQPGSRQRKKMEHIFGARLRMLPVDPAGRVVLPQEMRAKFGLDEAVAFVGNDQTFQIWPAAKWAEEEARRDAEFVEEGNPLLGVDWGDEEEGA